jgi:Helix-turn-helix domain
MNMVEKRKHDRPDGATVTVARAGEILGVGRNRAYDAARKGQLPLIEIGNRKRVILSALKKMLQEEGSVT